MNQFGLLFLKFFFCATEFKRFDFLLRFRGVYLDKFECFRLLPQFGLILDRFGPVLRQLSEKFSQKAFRGGYKFAILNFSFKANKCAQTNIFAE